MTWYDRVLALVKPQESVQATTTAKYAMRWMQDDTLNRAIAKIRHETIETWHESRDPETRERAWLMLQAVDLFVERLVGLVENEKVEEAHRNAGDSPPV